MMAEQSKEIPGVVTAVNPSKILRRILSPRCPSKRAKEDNMAKRILVPVAQTSSVESLLPLLADLARGSGATVRLLHVAPLPESVVSGDGRVIAYADQEMSRLEAEGLDELRAVEADLETVPVERVVRFGEPVEEILLEADAFGADLIAVTTANRSWLSRAVRPGVAERVFRKAEIPVMLVRQR